MHTMHTIHITATVDVGLWASNKNSVRKTMTALYPRPTALLGIRPALLVEDGGLAPAFSKRTGELVAVLTR